MTENYVDDEEEADVTRDYLEENYWDKEHTWSREEIMTEFNLDADLLDATFHTVTINGGDNPHLWIGPEDGPQYLKATAGGGIEMSGNLVCGDIDFSGTLTVEGEDSTGTMINATGIAVIGGMVSITGPENTTALSVEQGNLIVHAGSLQVRDNLDIYNGSLTFSQGVSRNRLSSHLGATVDKEYFDLDDVPIVGGGLAMDITHHVRMMDEEDFTDTLVAKFSRTDDGICRMDFSGDAYVQSDKLVTQTVLSSAVSTLDGEISSLNSDFALLDEAVDGKLSTVAVDSASFTGNGTASSPLALVAGAGGGGGTTVVWDGVSLIGSGTSESKLHVNPVQQVEFSD
jgi:hypothetical protein